MFNLIKINTQLCLNIYLFSIKRINSAPNYNLKLKGSYSAYSFDNSYQI